MIKNIHYILALVAGIIVGIVSIVVKDDMPTFFTKVGIALIIFVLIGFFLRNVLLNMMKNVDDKEESIKSEEESEQELVEDLDDMEESKVDET